MIKNSFSARDARTLVRLMKATHDPHFGAKFRRVMQSYMTVCTFLIINYRHDRPPISLYHWIPDRDLLNIYEEKYLTGFYKLDPYYKMGMGEFRSGLYRLKDIAPDRFFSTEYYKLYYSETGLIDEVGTMAPQNDGSVSGISMSTDRTGKPFSRTELNKLRVVGPILAELVRRHYEANFQDRNPENTNGNDSSLGEILFNYCNRVYKKPLTRREAEVAALVLEGHSSLSIGLNMQIATSTVKVHRKNIYRKFQISSQAELFSALHSALDQKSRTRNLL